MLFTVFFTIIFIGYLNLFFLVLTAESELENSQLTIKFYKKKIAKILLIYCTLILF